MKKNSGLKLENGADILTYEYVQSLRDADKKKANAFKIIAQAGAQERMLAIDADVKIVGGNRGGSKTFSLLLEALRDIKNPKFKAIILRNGMKDLDDLISSSYEVYKEFGYFNKSINDKTWNFNNDGYLKMSYYAGNMEDFETRFRGRQFSYIGIDEVTQIPYKKFKFLLTNNRNAAGIRNRIWGTCNPDPDSWVRKFIDWWIGDDGFPIPERDGVIRYCFMDGDSVENIYWGDSPEEVYEQCKSIIDEMWSDEYEAKGLKKTMFVKSVVFIRATLADNEKLLLSDPSYLSNLAGQPKEVRDRELGGNWNARAYGDDMISLEDMNAFFVNSQQLGDNVRRASCDVAFEGGDNLVMWFMIGNHISDLMVCKYDCSLAVSVVKAKLSEWGVEERNFTYDLNGLGQAFKGFFPDAVPFNNMSAPIASTKSEEKGIKALYHDLKSQAAFLFYRDIKERVWSIEPSLLTRKYSGNGFSNVELRTILNKEIKSIRRNENSEDKGFWILPKKLAKKIVGHSPDFIEGLYYSKIFSLRRRTTKVKGLWMV